MSLFESRTRSDAHEKLNVLVRITGLEHMRASGVMQNLTGGDSVPFQDLGELVMALNDMADSAHTPEQTEALTGARSGSLADPGGYGRAKTLFEMDVAVLYRQHCSLQGQLRLRGVPATFHFRSALELMYLISSVVCDDGDARSRAEA